MAGISNKAAGKLENRYKFNGGTELENKEFSDGGGLEWYAAEFRSYDHQIGRLLQIDPLAEQFEDLSPYTFAYNNPISYSDPTGLAPTDTIPHMEAVVVTAKIPKKLDTKNGQVLHPVGFFGDLYRNWNGYSVGRDGYLDMLDGKVMPAITLLTVPDIGKKSIGKAVVNKWLVYRAYKKVNGRLKLYIGKAKNSLKNRYTQKEIEKIGAEVLENLNRLPDNATALGVEQAILTLNGGVGATANIKNAAVKEVYVETGLKWLNENIPNWKDVFKFQ